VSEWVSYGVSEINFNSSLFWWKSNLLVYMSTRKCKINIMSKFNEYCFAIRSSLQSSMLSVKPVGNVFTNFLIIRIANENIWLPSVLCKSSSSHSVFKHFTQFNSDICPKLFSPCMPITSLLHSNHFHILQWEIIKAQHNKQYDCDETHIVF